MNGLKGCLHDTHNVFFLLLLIITRICGTRLIFLLLKMLFHKVMGKCFRFCLYTIWFFSPYTDGYRKQTWRLVEVLICFLETMIMKAGWISCIIYNWQEKVTHPPHCWSASSTPSAGTWAAPSCWCLRSDRTCKAKPWLSYVGKQEANSSSFSFQLLYQSWREKHPQELHSLKLLKEMLYIA